ncbi:hypothetical protein U0C82_05370 [Fulvimarina sp. 2208YS6-2-32]|uniref:Uncharacterized protein n=1 Tax=Fulvimarina uroteuthidis TaxID=3098149 RepID=A0ABU5HZM7_9HYPH|nr:hypothetical protein [Fulvimarina sp. 2208YS6-2-32]MDY8108584.1 hypothetical protein [Fulvimarina sp. 2208YS6-2-32]
MSRTPRTASYRSVAMKLRNGQSDFGTNPFKPSRFPTMHSLFGRN